MTPINKELFDALEKLENSQLSDLEARRRDEIKTYQRWIDEVKKSPRPESEKEVIILLLNGYIRRSARV